MRVVCLVDNTSGGYYISRYSMVTRHNSPDRVFLAEHGLSLLIEADDKSLVLMDTGATGIPLRHNMKLMGISTADIDKVFITHGHWDHTGGLRELIGSGCEVLTHPEAWSRDRDRDSPRGRLEVSFPSEVKEAIEPVFTSKQRMLAPGVMTTGEIKRTNDVEGTSGATYVIDGERFEDDFIDEQGLILTTEMGGVLLTGCSHPGIVNMVTQAQRLTDDGIFMVMGGFHLAGVGRDRMEWTAKRLKELGIEVIAPMHCTGHREARSLALRFDGFELVTAGSSIDLRVPSESF